MSKPTPGPWHVDAHKNVMAAGGLVAFPGIAAGFDQEANARLIAAAPEQNAELVKVLRFLADLNGCEWIKGDDAGSVDMRQRARALQSSVCAAIAKATGESK